MLLVGAVLVPVGIFIAVQIGFTFYAQQESLKATSLARAEAIMATIDGKARRTRALALATSEPIKSTDWPSAFSRAREIAYLNPDWRNVTLIDVQQAVSIFDLKRPFGKQVPLTRDATWSDVAGKKIVFGDMQRAGSGCPCISVFVPIVPDDKMAYLLKIEIDPAMTQAVLLSQAPDEGVSSVVDRRGTFIARTRDYQAKIGTPATPYLRNALLLSDSGQYWGISLKGQVSHTAYAKSDLTGWSTHIAVPSVTIGSPMWWSRTAIAVVAVVCMALALVFSRALVGAARKNERLTTSCSWTARKRSKG
jgi:hypothetical protein